MLEFFAVKSRVALCEPILEAPVKGLFATIPIFEGSNADRWKIYSVPLTVEQKAMVLSKMVRLAAVESTGQAVTRGVLNAVTLPALLVLLHAAASCAMAGVLWIVQLVVYPAFAIVPVDTLPTYAVAHARRITPIVAPLMLVEAMTFVALVAMKVDG